MADTCTDNLWAVLAALEEDVRTALDACGAAVCRSGVVAGSTPAWDTCCECDSGGDGQLSIHVTRVIPTDGIAQTPDPARFLSCAPRTLTADVNVLVLRCAQTVSESGKPPTATALTDEARAVHLDRAIVAEAIREDWAVTAETNGWDWLLGAWTPVGPQGGCVGGTTVLQVQFYEAFPD